MPYGFNGESKPEREIVPRTQLPDRLCQDSSRDRGLRVGLKGSEARSKAIIDHGTELPLEGSHRATVYLSFGPFAIVVVDAAGMLFRADLAEG